MSKIACVFPGQGSQSVGMLKELADDFSIVGETFSEASQALGYDLWSLVQNDPEQQLNQTHITQPALLTASVAAWRVWQQKVAKPVAFLAGHSLGEYSALTCAGVLALGDAVSLVKARGEFMQEAVPAGAGAMYAIIGLDDQAIIEACAKAAASTSEVVAAVNFNSPGQVVIAGTKDAAQAAAALCKEAGAKRALPLAVSVPSHCALMQSAADQLADRLQSLSFSAPTIAVVNNVDVAVETSPEAIKNALVRQLYMPVQWTRSISYLAQQGVSDIIEVGPGKVLTGLNKRIDKSLNCSAFNSPADI